MIWCGRLCIDFIAKNIRLYIFMSKRNNSSRNNRFVFIVFNQSNSSVNNTVQPCYSVIKQCNCHIWPCSSSYMNGKISLFLQINILFQHNIISFHAIAFLSKLQNTFELMLGPKQNAAHGMHFSTTWT